MMEKNVPAERKGFGIGGVWTWTAIDADTKLMLSYALRLRYVERQNLTMRTGMRRFTRLTNGFSKKVENLQHAVAIHYMHYNFARVHQTLRVTPAMEAGIAGHVWEIEEIVALLD